MSITRMISTVAATSTLFLAGALLVSPTATAGLANAAESEQTPQEYVAAALKMMDNYGYYATGKKWRTARAKAVRQTANAKTLRATYQPLQVAAKAAGGKHSFLLTKQEAKSDNRGVLFPTVQTTSGVTTVVLPEFGSSRQTDQRKYADATAAAIAAADADPAHCGFIVDLRDNFGGNMYPMLGAISPMIPDGKFFGIRDRTGGTQWTSIKGGAIEGYGRALFTTPTHPKVTEPIAVLYGKTASSAEAAAISLVGLDNTRSFGTETSGYASANLPMPLKDGATLVLTIAMDVDRTGQVYEESRRPGLLPDQATSIDAADEAAVAWIHQQCAAR